MAKARFKKVHDMRTVIRMGAVSSTLSASGNGTSIQLDIPPAGRFHPLERPDQREARIKGNRVLGEIAKTICELHGIREKPQPKRGRHQGQRRRQHAEAHA